MNKERFRLVAVTSFLLLAMGLAYLWVPRVYAQGSADLTIPLPAGLQFWENPYVKTDDPHIQVGVNNPVSAYIQNLDSVNDAYPVYVGFSYQAYGVLGSSSPWIPIGVTSSFTVNCNDARWSPTCNWIPIFSGHVCLKAEVYYVNDPNSNNNVGQHNLWVELAAPGSKLTIPFKVHVPEVGKPFTGLNLVLNTANLPEGTNVTIDNPPPYNLPINGSITAGLTIELPTNIPRETKDFNVTVAGTYANGTVYGGFTVIIEFPVGGVIVPINKTDLLAPFLGVTSASLGTTVAVAAFAKRIKRRKGK